ncbi:archaeal heat shock protein Hsp20 [Acidilobus sp.]|uniref:archaeal heat shock protein Hsp20 n=1 Tax=Acidilobus sp. TaxID=1872109 RepID=UPI003CFE675E
MSDERKKKRRSFDDIFDEIDDLMRRFEEEFEDMERDFEDLLKNAPTKEGPYYYGVRVYVGPDGVPHIEQFGNIKKEGRGKVIISDETEPMVDVMERDDEVWVVADLPGVDKDQIKVSATERTVSIRAEGDKRKYSKEVELPAVVDPSSAKATFKNGVLEIKFKKLQGSKGSVNIKIE